jgi:hypothetical protein
MLRTPSGPRLRHRKRTLYGRVENPASMRVSGLLAPFMVGGIFVYTGATQGPGQQHPPVVIGLPPRGHEVGRSASSVAHGNGKQGNLLGGVARVLAVNGGYVLKLQVDGCKFGVEVENRGLRSFGRPCSCCTAGNGDARAAPALQEQRRPRPVRAECLEGKGVLACGAPFAFGHGCAHVRCRVHWVRLRGRGR